MPVPDRDRPVDLSTRSELADLVESYGRVLVEFYTEGCGICASMEPVMGAIARTEDVVVATMNPRDDPELIEEFEVRSVPTLLYFEDGDLVETVADGFMGVDDVRAFLATA